ncbi:MAG: pyruvate, water dikinase [Methanohalophilus sp. T328-1]|nr:MAG: pyruvate, water dikinase [Methanohalophilus sp. T328-1]
MSDNKYIRWFEEITIDDVSLVGGKNASLGEMYRELLSQVYTSNLDLEKCIIG